MDIELRLKFEKETGKQSHSDSKNKGYYSNEYVYWLEKQLNLKKNLKK